VPEEKLKRLHADISRKLHEIDALFTRSPKITIVFRMPWTDDGGVLLTNDELELAIAEIRRLADKSPVA